MTFKARGYVFATFLLNAIIAALLIASLTTEFWIIASPQHPNKKATGSLNFGLFAGNKELNIAYGSRFYRIDVVQYLRDEPNASYWLWRGTVSLVGLSLFGAVLSSIAGIIKTVSAAKKRGTMILLFFSNVATVIAQLLALACWIFQFHQYLQFNVLTHDDHQNSWNSSGTASLGMSFYFVVAGIVLGVLCIIFLMKAHSLERTQLRHIEPPTDEKTNAAIMLY